MNPRLRRSSSISQFVVGAALEALGGKWEPDRHGRLGVIVCVLSGCVGYSRRFYEETLKDPATASPLVFPETVFNAPASHLGAFLGNTGINYTLVGDTGTCLVGLGTAAGWIADGRVDSCLVVAGEEMDWLTADALSLFDQHACFADGAGALLLTRTPARVKLECITSEHLFAIHGAATAAKKMRAELLGAGTSGVLVDGAAAQGRLTRVERELWQDWTGERIRPKPVTGEGLIAGAAWECALGCELVQRGKPRALISVVGTHQQAIGASFVSGPSQG